VKFGPTPSTRLIVEGEVIEKDDLRKEIIIRITTMTSIPREIAKNIMSKNLISFSLNDSLRYVADVLYSRNIRGGPVIEDGKIVGLITTSEIAKALKEGSLDAKVSDYIRKDVHVVNENEDILNVIKKMVSLNVGRLIVIDSEGKTIGIVTRTDILKRFAGLIEL